MFNTPFLSASSPLFGAIPTTPSISSVLQPQRPIQIWNYETGSLLGELQCQGEVVDAQFGPNPTFVALISWRKISGSTLSSSELVIQIPRLQTGKCFGEFYPGSVNPIDIPRVAIFSDLTPLASTYKEFGDGHGHLEVWEVGTHKRVLDLALSDGWRRSNLEFSHSSEYLHTDFGTIAIRGRDSSSCPTDSRLLRLSECSVGYGFSKNRR